MPELLVASHIIPWSKNEKERLNPRNGLCLNALHDKAFDKGFITITTKFEVKISQALRDLSDESTINKYFISFDNEKIKVPRKFVPSKDFLDYHYENIFIK